MREYHYVVDREGRVFHDGTEVVDPLTLRFFLKAMTRTAEGRYLVVCQGEHNWFHADDTPFVVQRLRLAHDALGLAAVDLCLPGDVREPLDPSTLWSAAGHLFCRLDGRGFPARFGRVPMQQIAPFVAEADGAPVLVLGGARYAIRDMTGVIPAGPPEVVRSERS
jgi:hypothetical protein